MRIETISYLKQNAAKLGFGGTNHNHSKWGNPFIELNQNAKLNAKRKLLRY